MTKDYMWNIEYRRNILYYLNERVMYIEYTNMNNYYLSFFDLDKHYKLYKKYKEMIGIKLESVNMKFYSLTKAIKDVEDFIDFKEKYQVFL